MSRPAVALTLVAALAASLTATGAVSAQDRTQPTAARDTVRAAPPAAQSMSSQDQSARDAELRARGETYRRSGDEEQDPAELERTRQLNADITARNNAAARSEADARATWEASQNQHRADTAAYEEALARIETETAQRQADFERSRAEWERANAAYQAELAACRATGRCVETGPR